MKCHQVRNLQYIVLRFVFITNNFSYLVEVNQKRPHDPNLHLKSIRGNRTLYICSSWPLLRTYYLHLRWNSRVLLINSGTIRNWTTRILITLHSRTENCLLTLQQAVLPKMAAMKFYKIDHFLQLRISFELQLILRTFIVLLQIWICKVFNLNISQWFSRKLMIRVICVQRNLQIYDIFL